MLSGEPRSDQEIAAWITSAIQDRFANLYRASEAHRLRHGPGCTVYPTGSGPLLGVLALAIGARHLLEVGCGLGYSAAWLAFGSAPSGRVETVEQDPAHAVLARRHLQVEGYDTRVTILEGRGIAVLPRLSGPYDMIFCDGDLAEYVTDLDHFRRLLRDGGLLVSSNLFLGRYDPNLPGLEQAAAYRLELLSDPHLRTVFLPGGLALSLRVSATV